jgi:hypothetical protein
MRTLRNVELHLDGTFPVEQAKRFLIASCAVCNFVEKHLKQIRFESPYSRVNIFCSAESRESYVRPYSFEPYLHVIIPFSPRPIEALSEAEAQQQFIRALSMGLEAARQFTPMPLYEAKIALANFERGGYLNKWEHLDKQWIRKDCQCIISMEVNMQCFIAHQAILVKNSLVANKRIAQTSPRDGLWVDYLGKLSITKANILEYKRADKLLSAFDLDKKTFLHPTDA